MALFYRVRAFGEPRGPWRSTKRKAQDDAIAQDLGEYDEGGTFYLSAPADLEWIHEDQLRKRA